MLLRFAFLLLIFFGGTTSAAPPTPGFSREQTLDQDLLGPRIEMQGEITGILPDGADTCFILLRLDYGFGQDVPGNRYLVCQPGLFNLPQFSPGSVLQVTGNLGIATPRSIGGQTLDYPLIASAIVQPIGWARPYWPPPPGYYPGPAYPYPYRDPYWRPWPYRSPWYP